MILGKLSQLCGAATEAASSAEAASRVAEASVAEASGGEASGGEAGRAAEYELAGGLALDEDVVPLGCLGEGASLKLLQCDAALADEDLLVCASRYTHTHTHAHAHAHAHAHTHAHTHTRCVRAAIRMSAGC